MGFLLQAPVGPEAEPLGDAGPEPLDQDVDAGDEPAHQVEAGLRLEIEDGRSTPAQQQAVGWVDARPTWPLDPHELAMSASIIPANGPGPIDPSSSTRTPASGPPRLRSDLAAVPTINASRAQSDTPANARRRPGTGSGRCRR